jgi:hypothetical protein
MQFRMCCGDYSSRLVTIVADYETMQNVLMQDGDILGADQSCLW